MTSPAESNDTRPTVRRRQAIDTARSRSIYPASSLTVPRQSPPELHIVPCAGETPSGTAKRVPDVGRGPSPNPSTAGRKLRNSFKVQRVLGTPLPLAGRRLVKVEGQPCRPQSGRRWVGARWRVFFTAIRADRNEFSPFEYRYGVHVYADADAG